MQEVVRHGGCPTKPNLTTPEFVGELPRRSNSVSDKFRLPTIPPILGMKVKQGERVFFFKDTPMNNHINGELSTRPLH